MARQLLVRERHGAVLELRMDNPPYNGLTGPLLVEYVAALAEARTDDTVRAVVTTSAVPTWCAGGDLSEIAEEAVTAGLSDLLHASTKETPHLSLAERQADRLGVGRYILAIDGFEKPLIAAVGGPAAGGGLALALLHDVRFVSDRAVFTTAFTRIGLSLEMGLSYLLPRAIGPQAAFDLAVTSRRVPADEAVSLGLAWRLVPHDELAATAIGYAAELAERAPLGVQLAKRLLRRSWDHRFEDQLEAEWPWQAAAFDSPDSRAAVAEFARRAHKGDAGS
ncbi:MAG TPA: enoyl-CoA hydratase/isomerase family protein [Acidimicrobiales bacterium]|nr:enoyl-CoA hydratase/isomerase family protein [Acidimicrobiales bacterium]